MSTMKEKYKAGDIIQVLKSAENPNHASPECTKDGFLVVKLLEPPRAQYAGTCYINCITLTHHILGVGYNLHLLTEYKYIRKLPKFAFAHLLP